MLDTDDENAGWWDFPPSHRMKNPSPEEVQQINGNPKHKLDHVIGLALEIQPKSWIQLATAARKQGIGASSSWFAKVMHDLRADGKIPPGRVPNSPKRTRKRSRTALAHPPVEVKPVARVRRDLAAASAQSKDDSVREAFWAFAGALKDAPIATQRHTIRGVCAWLGLSKLLK